MRTFATALALLACLITLLFVVTGRYRVEARQAAGAGADRERKGAVLPISTGSRLEPSPGAPELAAFLEPYFEDRWPEAKAELEHSGVDLSSPRDPNVLPDWTDASVDLTADSLLSDDDISRHVRDALSWPGGTTFAEADFVGNAFYNPDQKRLAATDYDAIKRIAVPYEDRVRPLAESAAVAFQAAMQELWVEGKYGRYPLVALKLPSDDSRHVRCMRMISARNWYVVAVLHAGDSPAYEEALKRVNFVKAERDEAVRAYVAGLPSSTTR
jgi:hypothetical protein